MAENEENGTEELAEVAEDIGEEIADEIAEVVDDTGGDVDVDVAVIEAPEIPETSYVDVGDLHISGPPEMVERITKTYLADHIDHNPHGENHGETDGPVEEFGQAITPEPVEEIIAESAAGEVVDSPPTPTDFLFRPLGGNK